MSASALSTLTAALLMVSGAGAPQPVAVSARVETPAVYDDEAGGNADADDPAVWVDPDHPGRSLVIGTLKKAGLDVYGLDGRRLQHIAAPEAPNEDAAPGRFNNVDVVYGFELGGRKTDLALVSDRGRDRVRAYAIDPAAVAAGRPPLKDVTAADAAPVFSASEAEVDDQRTAYGLAAFSDDDHAYAVVSRRSETRVRLLRLEDHDGRVGYKTKDTLDLPASFTLPNGSSWTPCADPGDRPQVEGMVVDQERHVLYAAQEDVGLWRVDLDDEEFDRPKLIDRVREYGTPWRYDAEEEECVLDTADDPGFGGEHLSADAEGAAIYHAADGTGYLLASSQGDNTFAVYERQGQGAYLGSFTVTDSAATDGVQHSDGSTVVNVPLGRSFPKGLLVTHDGEATPADGDREGTDFKFTGWESVAGAFPKPLTIDTKSFDPRDTD
ncbi:MULTISPECIES: phytase [unclassified Streptomyces]|uniref:phytase n=1 Tax=unclassified Streptomyces TaxID=2593676 RepID=UPI0023660FCF|nr:MULTISPECIES: phytase [unclassified Streptomyces]MDF3147128.1 phytase [Streptomyces sp. T21Q-yed]WDF43237.1 phytase [Streptomyces sp. T12]